MALSTATEFKAILPNWFNRQDMSQQFDDLITLAESTLNRIVRDPRMVAFTDVTVSGGTAYGDLPTACLEVLGIANKASEFQMLEPLDEAQMRRTRRLNQTDGVAAFYWINGMRFDLCPTPADQTTYVVKNYARLDTLVSNSTNWLLTNYPDIYLITVLLHGQAFLKDDTRAQLLSMMVSQQILTAVEQDRKIQPQEISTGATLTSPADAR